jgi:hypothetical protein
MRSFTPENSNGVKRNGTWSGIIGNILRGVLHNLTRSF